MSSRTVSSVGEYLTALREPAFRLGLGDAPVNPWYLGQHDLDGSLLAPLYKAKIDPLLEREMLRDFRMTLAEFTPLKGLTDADIMIHAHLNNLPVRILEWSGNPLVALYFACENLDISKDGRVWILNPWVLNDLVASLTYVPMTDSEYMRRYVLLLDDPEALPYPEATQPMAFRPYRLMRYLTAQNIYFTIHGRSPGALEDLSFFLKRTESYLTYVTVEGVNKRFIMKQLHDLNVTRAALFPTLTGLCRTIAYRYSSAYLRPNDR
jgi:hypothetical protein